MVKDKTRYRYNVRRWLNLKGYHGAAHVIAQVENTSDKAMDEHYWPDIDLVIADCSRSISLDFSDLSDGGSRQNALRKLDMLISVLEQFRSALRAEAKLAATRERNIAAKKATKDDN